MLLSDRTQLRSLSKDELIDIILSQQALILELKEKITSLENELKKYINSNTPPSANKHLKPNTKGKQKKRKAKKGAPKGHPGKTRKKHPTSKKVIDTDTCPNCASTNIENVKVVKKIIEEISEPAENEFVETTEYEIHIKKCLNCGKVFVPEKAKEIPRKGIFGINITILVVFLKLILRGVLRKIVTYLWIGYKLRMTPASVNTILRRASEACLYEYTTLKKRIRNADKVYVDETSFSVLGKNWWVWVFRTNYDILLVVRNSRGSSVLKEILGEAYKGKVICDCWKAYNFLGILQRCWAHLLRKAKEYKAIPEGKAIYRLLKKLFKEIKRFNSKKQISKMRLEKYKNMTGRLKRSVKRYKKYTSLKKLLTYIGNNIENWFTCIRYPGIEPTNNFAEQAIRETVILRKIVGAFRSEQGPADYEILGSMLATWQLQNKDVRNELKNVLKLNLCIQ